MLIRPIRESDLDGLIKLAEMVGYGLTSMQTDKEYMLERIEKSIRGFKSKEDTTTYTLVLEDDTKQNKVVGTTSVTVEMDKKTPFYVYEINPPLPYLGGGTKLKKEHFLHQKRIYGGYSMVGGLILDTTYRGMGLGKLISYSRFMLILKNRSFFKDKIIAEMRGVSDEKGDAPFWNAVCAKYFDMDFNTADKKSATEKSFLEEGLPREPISVNLLPEDAKEVLGVTHKDSAPAAKMLLNEGFNRTNMVDVFDGGPILMADTDELKTIKRSVEMEVREVKKELKEGKQALISVDKPEFMVTKTEVDVDGLEISIKEKTADLLKVEAMDEITVRVLD